MGADQSVPQQHTTLRPESSGAGLHSLESQLPGSPKCTSQGVMEFPVKLMNPELFSQKTSICLLEVGAQGIRLLRPDTRDALAAIPWTQIHSWTNNSGRFNFKFCDERVKGLCTCQVMLEHGEALMTHISHVIGAIVRERQTMSVNDEEIASLCAALEKEAEPDRLAALQPKLTAHHFTTSQAVRILRCFPDPFDIIEAAVLLHPRLINQNQFHAVLTEFSGVIDVDNVWHRVAQNNKGANNPFKHRPSLRTIK